MNTSHQHPLRRAREKRGLSLAHVGELLRVDKGHLARKEKGTRPIDPDEARVLHELYAGEVTFEQIFRVPATLRAAERSLKARRA